MTDTAKDKPEDKPPAKPARVYEDEIDADGSVVPAGLGIAFARKFCKDLPKKTLDALFPPELA